MIHPYRGIIFFGVLLVAVATTQAQPTPAETVSNTRILTYIDHSWDTLSRSMTDCNSLGDIKVTTQPVLYLPAGMPTPPALADVQQHCNVQVRHLPRTIQHMGDVRPTELPVEGLLYLPNKYVVPGGRFNEMYGWDSYFILLGLVHDHRTALARGMLDNFFFEIQNYGAILNANRTYFFTRSQPPFLTSMIREVYEHPDGQPLSKAWLAQAYQYAQRDYTLWIAPNHQAANTGLARYNDIGEGPVPEMADDSNYYPDVIRWLLAHPEVHTNFLIEAPDNPTPAQAAELNRTSCNLNTSKVCARAHFNGHRLTADFFRGDRAMRESGFDTSFRFGPFSGATNHYAPICLNSLLYKYERDMAHFATLLNKPADAALWNHRADARRTAINRYLWNPASGLFVDYNFTTRQQSTYNYVTAFYPLWAGLATTSQAKTLSQHLNLFEHDGGLAMSDNPSGTQWDLPYGWAPTNWIAIHGLTQYGFTAPAQRIAQNFSATILQNFLLDGTMREKYNVVSGSANFQVAAGYKANVVGFGWTNGVYLQMHDLISNPPSASTSAK